MQRQAPAGVQRLLYFAAADGENGSLTHTFYPLCLPLEQRSEADGSCAPCPRGKISEAVNAAQESFRYTEQKFNVGMVNTTDYNAAKNKVIKAQTDLLQAKYEYVFKSKVLDFYQGRPLKF